ncbi:MAG: hypothetical protein HRT53_09545 [Colwellia sp.]|nr:hypothetical protein [Colwellia sp.]
MILNLKNSPLRLLLSKNKTAVFDDKVTLPPFYEGTIEAFSQLGLFLMKNGRREPSIVAAGYWLRKKHLLTIKQQYHDRCNTAKGVAFHIAPGNVDTLFFYSIVVSVLSGNQTILRISNKLTQETQFFIELLADFFNDHKKHDAVYALIHIIQYQHDTDHGHDITLRLSLFADARVIWGGDAAVAEISEIPQKIDANNITFPDRYSVAVIHLENDSEIGNAVNQLITDIKPFYQQACSSPKVIYWLDTAQQLQEKFWLLFIEKTTKQLSLSTSDLISQLVYLQRLPLLLNHPVKNKLNVEKYNELHKVDVEFITLDAIKAHCGLWTLLSLQITTLADIKLFSHCQTVTTSGIDVSIIEQWQQSAKLAETAKRFVPAGQALTFSHIWDGIDLIDSLTS